MKFADRGLSYKEFLLFDYIFQMLVMNWSIFSRLFKVEVKLGGECVQTFSIIFDSV